MQVVEPNAPSLTVGMPVYNGERFIARALSSLLEQDFRDWTLIVADNCSTDGTCAVVDAFCRLDARIRLMRHERNLGAVANFLYLAEQAATPYFMWAAHDDEWSSNYISACLAQLEAHPDAGFAGGRVVNIDAEGQQLREYGSFAPFAVADRRQRLRNFIRAREADGKANMIYSVFRTPLLQTVCRIPDILDGWGADMAFVAAALARARYLWVHNEVLLKRVLSESDQQTARALAARRYDQVECRGHYPLPVHEAYTRSLCKGMPDRATSMIVKTAMGRRRWELQTREQVTKVLSLPQRAINRLGRSS